MSNQVLKPCPFCGGVARLDQRETESLWNHNDATFSHVSCEDCEIVGRDFCDDPNGEEAIEWWNTRATPAPIPDAKHERAMVVPDGWGLELMGPDDVVKLSRADGKWCGITHLSDSPRDGLLYPFLRAMLAASPAPGDSQ